MRKLPGPVIGLLGLLFALLLGAFFLGRQSLPGIRLRLQREPAAEARLMDGGPSETAPLDLNRADLTALMELPGIGETRARAILAYREEHGLFRACEELMNVPGIGAGIYEGLRDLVCVEAANEDTDH